MKKASNVALAIGAGYLLGRKRKLRLALVLAGAATTGKVGGIATQAMKRGGSLVGSPEAIGKLSPELGNVMGTVKNDLADAGKAAVRAAAVNRVNRLTDSLHERAEGFRSPRDADEAEDEAEDDAEAGEPEPDEPDEDSRGGRRTGRDATAAGPASGRREAARPRRREPSGRDTDRPGRRREQDHDHRGGGTSRRSAKRAADGGSRSPSARKRGK